MNFCPECGTDLRANPNTKFCFNCGNQMVAAENVITSQSKSDSVILANNIHEDDFDYFDFPEEKYFRDFMLEVAERVETNPNLSNEEVAKKYLTKGIKLLEEGGLIIGRSEFYNFAILWNEERENLVETDVFYKNSLQQKIWKFLENNFELTRQCFEASLFFVSNQPMSYYHSFVCYHFAQEFNEAQRFLNLYAETTKELFGLENNKTNEAARLCNTYYSINSVEYLSENVKAIKISEKLPNWIAKLDMPI